MLALSLLLLTGCKSELYSHLSEADANQMLALLLYHHIPAEKTVGDDGVTLKVDQTYFVDAVETLRQNGLPRPETVGIQDLFPSGQLITSPEQEQAKLNYFRSQQIQRMLQNMDGVIVAQVSVADPATTPGESPAPASASVFIKYSPDINLPAQEAEIRELIRNGIPGLQQDKIALTLQRAKYRFQPPPVIKPERSLLHRLTAIRKALPEKGLIAIGAFVALLMTFTLIALCRRRKP